MFFVLLSTKEEGKRGKQNGAERLIFLRWSSRHLWSINSVSPSVHSSCFLLSFHLKLFLSRFPKLFAAVNLYTLVVVNLISCSVPFPYPAWLSWCCQLGQINPWWFWLWSIKAPKSLVLDT
jgi:hypothetical protein